MVRMALLPGALVDDRVLDLARGQVLQGPRGVLLLPLLAALLRQLVELSGVRRGDHHGLVLVALRLRGHLSRCEHLHGILLRHSDRAAEKRAPTGIVFTSSRRWSSQRRGSGSGRRSTPPGSRDERAGAPP